MSPLLPVPPMSTVIQVGTTWPTFAGIERLVIFGDSYSSVGSWQPGVSHPTAENPLGVAFPGSQLWNEYDRPNWVGHLITKYCSAPRRYTPGVGNTEAILVYDYAVGGHRVQQLQQQQVIGNFLPHLAQRPHWAPWSAETTLFVTWIGINDCAWSTEPNHTQPTLFQVQEQLYDAGARNFLFINLPPIHKTPAFHPRVGADDAAMPYLRWNMALHDGIQDFCTRHRDITALLFSSYATFHQILTNPAQYGFSSADLGLGGGRIWLDHIHPSSAVHDVLARDLAEFLNSIPPG